MKLHFEDNLDYQNEAISSVVGLFKGQELSRNEFTVAYRSSETPQIAFGMTESDLGIGNKLELSDDEILKNIQDIQLCNGLSPSEALVGRDFTVEMETGTGKTYVYLRTIFELNKRYGFTKFIIVVPSIAIKEGTYKTLQITREHIENLYPMARGYEYFQYDSNRLAAVRNFATSPSIQIMVVTVGAINKKDTNNLYKHSEKTGGERPIDLVRATNPIIVVDEPQSVDGGLGGRGRKALGAMAPLCTLRYSATHVDKHHMVYRLDAVDAYERGLVKQVEIAALEVIGGHNRPYVRLISTQNKSGSILAKVEVDMTSGGELRRQVVTVEDGDNLENLTQRPLYENYRIGTIAVGKNNQSVELSMPDGEKLLRPGEEVGGVDSVQLNRLMIQRTIKEHLDKEKRFRAENREVKVLSLFFIDSVKHYRRYESDGKITKGDCAQIFEEELRKFASHPDYQNLFADMDLETEIDEIHNGYFSIDRKGLWTETNENNQISRECAERAYSLIMKDKEKLLSFESKLRFIFSHSALKEGWDNPNVFQICVLRDIGTERERRQTLGRGLRLCVNQNGERLRGSDVNTLTVIATESYEEFAEALQKEIEKEAGIRFGIVEKHQFARIATSVDDGTFSRLGTKKSEIIWTYLRDLGFINADGGVKDRLRVALNSDSFFLPKDLKEHQGGVVETLKKLASNISIKNADEKIPIRVRKSILESEEFKALWDRIKHKTIYRVEFDTDRLICECASAIENSPGIARARAQFHLAEIKIGKGGVQANETSTSGFTSIFEDDIEIPDLLTYLQDKTQLTRRSLARILIQSRRLADLKKNPQEFLDLVVKAVNGKKNHALVDGIKYFRIGNDSYYAQELFQNEELTGYFKNTVASEKSVFDRVLYDQGVEKTFAEELKKNEAVKVFTKLPRWFKIRTPLGTYNPDWAIVIEDRGTERLYLVVESKSSVWLEQWRPGESDKFRCGEKHFAALKIDEVDNPARFMSATTVNDVLKNHSDMNA